MILLSHLYNNDLLNLLDFHAHYKNKNLIHCLESDLNYGKDLFSKVSLKSVLK